MITLIAAYSKERAIGRGGDIPWKSSADLALFKRETEGGLVMMGRKTWESLPKRPLPGRKNLVVTSDPISIRASTPDVLAATTIDAAIQMTRETGIAKVSIIGGQTIYTALMPFADRMVLTEMDLSIPDADTFFPGVVDDEWSKQVLHKHESLSHEDPSFTVYEFIRIGR
jgi:dihydrofolate reductase